MRDRVDLALELGRVARERNEALAIIARVVRLAVEWQADHDSGGNGRHGYHASEYADIFAADLRAALEQKP